MGKREDILTATRDIIFEDGLSSVSFSKIFSRAGVGSGTAYHYFESKEILIHTLYQECSDLMDREILAEYQPTATLKERFQVLLRSMARFVLTHRRELSVIVACGHSPTVDPASRLRVNPSMAAAVSLFAEGQRSGVFVPMDQTMAVLMITGAIIAVAQGQLDGKYLLDNSAVDEAVEACWRAMAKPGVSPRNLLP